VLAWVETDEGLTGFGYTYASTLGGRIVQVRAGEPTPSHNLTTGTRWPRPPMIMLSVLIMQRPVVSGLTFGAVKE
jgi:hypothetical protein